MKIDPIVQLLNDYGFRTSCVRGEGRGFLRPRVRVENRATDIVEIRRELCRFLIKQGATMFIIKMVSIHKANVLPLDASYVEVEFYNEVALAEFITSITNDSP
jgi:hypothetical protein